MEGKREAENDIFNLKRFKKETGYGPVSVSKTAISDVFLFSQKAHENVILSGGLPMK